MVRSLDAVKFTTVSSWYNRKRTRALDAHFEESLIPESAVC